MRLIGFGLFVFFCLRHHQVKMLFWNGSVSAWPAWTASLPTAPEPPTNLAIRVRKVAQVTWDPPATGGVTGYKLKLHALSEPSNRSGLDIHHLFPCFFFITYSFDPRKPSKAQ